MQYLLNRSTKRWEKRSLTWTDFSIGLEVTNNITAKQTEEKRIVVDSLQFILNL